MEAAATLAPMVSIGEAGGMAVDKGLVTADFVISLDGCIAGRDVSPVAPAGIGADALVGWMHGLASWRARQGMDGGIHNRDSEIIDQWFTQTGASVLGRRMFDLGEPFWGDALPFRTPVFVVTHRPRATIVSGETTVRFVDGIEPAVSMAREAAGGRAVDVGGGADIFQQCLAAGLVQELQLHIVPVIIGDGLRLFDRLPPLDAAWEIAESEHGEGALHVRYRTARF